MTGFIINGHSYTVGVGSGDIEYVGSGNHIGYSDYGTDIPSVDVLPDWIPTGNDTTDGVSCSYDRGGSGGVSQNLTDLYNQGFTYFDKKSTYTVTSGLPNAYIYTNNGGQSADAFYNFREPHYVYSIKWAFKIPSGSLPPNKLNIKLVVKNEDNTQSEQYIYTGMDIITTYEQVVDRNINGAFVQMWRKNSEKSKTVAFVGIYFNVYKNITTTSTLTLQPTATSSSSYWDYFLDKPAFIEEFTAPYGCYSAAVIKEDGSIGNFYTENYNNNIYNIKVGQVLSGIRVYKSGTPGTMSLVVRD